jgi:hypothetical protein
LNHPTLPEVIYFKVLGDFHCSDVSSNIMRQTILFGLYAGV